MQASKFCFIVAHWLVIDGVQPEIPENPIIIGHPPVRVRAKSEPVLDGLPGGSQTAPSTDPKAGPKQEPVEPNENRPGKVKEEKAETEDEEESEVPAKRRRTVAEVVESSKRARRERALGASASEVMRCRMPV